MATACAAVAMLEGDGALKHVVLLLAGQGRGHLQERAQVEDEGLGAGQLAGGGELHALPAGNEGGHLGRGGAVALRFCMIGGVAHGEIIPGKQVIIEIRIAILLVAAPAICYRARGRFVF